MSIKAGSLVGDWREVCLYVAGTHIVAVPVGTDGLPTFGSKIGSQSEDGEFAEYYSVLVHIDRGG